MKLLKSIILLLIALLLGIILIPIGIVFTFIKLIICMKFIEAYNHFCKLLFSIAISIDQLGNTACKYLFNAIFIKNDIIEFGNINETVSSVLGKNYKNNNLTFLGKKLNLILNLIETNHTLKSIEN